MGNISELIACGVTPEEQLLSAIATHNEATIFQALEAGASIEELIEVPALLGDYATLHSLLHLSIEMDNKISLYAIENALDQTTRFGHIHCKNDLQYYKIWLENMLSYEDKLLVDATRKSHLLSVQDALTHQTAMTDGLEYALIHSAALGAVNIIQHVLQWSQTNALLFSARVLKKTIIVTVKKQGISNNSNTCGILNHLREYGRQVTGDFSDMRKLIREAQEDALLEQQLVAMFALRARL